MFKSIGNNFGGPEITFKDFQNEHEIVLNAIFDYDPSNTAYQSAGQLEIYVPDLKIGRSAIAGCFFAGTGTRGPVGTAVKTWIKDRNTIVIEKLTAWDGCTSHRVYICTLYALRGFRGIEFELHKHSPLNLQQSATIGSPTAQIYFETPDWLFLNFSLGNLYWDAKSKICFLSSYRGIPDDIDATLPYVNGMYDRDMPGMNILPVHIKEGQILIADMPQNMSSGTGWDSMFYAFIVRDRNNTQEIEGTVKWHSAALEANRSQRAYELKIEMGGNPTMMSARMVSAYYGTSSFPYTVDDVPETMIGSEAFFVCCNTSGKGLTLQMAKLSFYTEDDMQKLHISTIAGSSSITFHLFDTSAAMPANL